MAVSKNRNLFILGLCGILILGAFGVFWQQKNAPSKDPGEANAASTPANNAPVKMPSKAAIEKVAFARESAQKQPSELSQIKQDIIARLRSEFSEKIKSIVFQVELKAMRDDLIKQFPQQGQKAFEEIIRTAFPDLADQIFAVIAKMDAYDQWLIDNMLTLNEMTLLEQRGELWAKRTELFGDDAKLIWSEELSAEQERKASVRKTVQMLDTAYKTTMDERLYLLQSSFDESFSGTLENAVFDTRGVLTKVFFGFDSVQRDLKKMSPEARQQEINRIRAQMGYSPKRIEELEARDQRRDERWQKGYDYMDARASVTSQYDGEQLEAELDKLRKKYFGDEASTIAKEEEDLQFFRYERPRLYGRN